ncbi:MULTISPECIES: cytochrome c family protein [unclassified Sphingomonas]|uniref:c-type cytochrome n=1 Tax=unclassified Sphingomonas TaxID=196159 RepID=UPI000BD9D7AC|nr:MAG: cytochrome c family protein [Sphingomonas sp. 32-62-10]
MDIRTNTIAGWILAALFVALGFGMVGNLLFKPEPLEKPGYPIEGAVEATDAGEAAPEQPIETLLASADMAKGAEVFKKCASCHNAADGGANGIGPNLWGIIGKPIAQHAGFAYSDVLKARGGNWDFATMNEWLTNPRKFASGTKMSFAGLANPEDRANVIVWLNAQGSNLPLPAAPEAAAAETTTTPDNAEVAADNAAVPAAE